MSKTKNMRRQNIRWQLLASVSTAALMISAYGAGEALAADSERPVLWIELGGQFSRLSDPQQNFDPAFLTSFKQPGALAALNIQSPPAYGLDEDATISFQPDNSDWSFSAALRYGRSGISRHHHQQTKNAFVPMYFTFYGSKFGPKYYYPSRFVRFADGKANQSERHLILDFTAGKDVGLGLFGSGSSSVVSAGVRFVQFTSKSKTHLSGIPDLQYPTAPITSFYKFFDHKYASVHFHHYAAAADIERSFRGVGPTLAWSASVPFAGNESGTELSIDWGANAALLFGRQRATGQFQTTKRRYDLTHWHHKPGRTGVYHDAGYFGSSAPAGQQPPPATQKITPGQFDRAKSVAVPNLGGFAGISLKWPNAKVSIGYKADFFFNAIDGGIDTRKSEGRGFFGPFASISVGLGD